MVRITNTLLLHLASRARTDTKTKLTASPEWKLLKFPEGYTLWLHKTGVQADPANPRTDAYLHGAPHLGSTAGRTSNLPPSPTVFRSPMEFVEHAIWLMRRGTGQCQCKYCTPGQNQIMINLRLDHESVDDGDDDVIVVDGDDGSGGGGGGGAGGSAGSGSGSGGGGVDNGGGAGGAGSASSSRQSSGAPRGRGASAHARRGRRIRREREKVMPIMAKDYRVGNQDSGPAPGPA